MLCGGKGRICVSGLLFQEAGICTSLLMQIFYPTYLQQSCKNQSRGCFQPKAAALGTLITERDANEAQLKLHQPWDTGRGSGEEAAIQGHQCGTGSIRSKGATLLWGFGFVPVWAGRELKAHPAPTPAKGRDTFHHPRSLQDGNSRPLWVFYPERG